MLRNGQEWRNVLAFSCEAANAMVECLQDVARLRLLQRLVRRRSEATRGEYVVRSSA
jgi:hypothetical protein